MFPTAGLFRGVLCPENDENKGRCKRPYCHFRHVRRVPPVEAATEPKNAGEQKAAKTRPAIESSSLPSHRRHRDRTPATKPIQYVPTPLFLCKKPSKDAFLEESTEEEEQASKDDVVGSDSGLSAYTPTPLAELEAMDNPDEATGPGGDDMLLMEAETGDCLEDQSTKVTEGGCKKIMPSNTDGKNLETERPSVTEEGEDMVIETHTYGGVTVTTRTPRSLCQPDQASVEEEEEEYNPFSSVFDSDEKNRVVMKGKVCEKVNESHKKTSQWLPEDKEVVPEGYFPEANLDPLSKSDEYPAYGISNDLMDDCDDKEKDFKGYSNTASYSYSDVPPMTDVDYQPYNYSCSDSHCVDDVLPTYSTSGNINEDSGFSMDVDGGYDMENFEQYHKEETTKLKWKSKFDKTNMAKKTSQGKGHKVLEGNKSTSKSNVEKKVVSNKKTEITGTSSKAMTLSKGKVGATSGKSVKVTSKAKPSQEKPDPKKLTSSNKKILKSKREVKTQPRDDNAKSESKKVKETDNNIKPVENTSMSDVKISEKDKVTEKSKPKVSAEQLANFFKKHQEVKGLKSKGKQKIGELKRTSEDNGTSRKRTEESKSLKSTSKGTSSHRKETNHKENVHSADAKVGPKGKEESPKTPRSDRSLFQSLGKPPTKDLPKKPTIKECNFDMFAVANDSSSDEDGVRSKTSSKSNVSVCSPPPRKRSVSLDKIRHASESDSTGKKKRTASPSKTNDPKRLRKLSTSLSKKESTKIIELDLFGDDSDADSDEVTLISIGSPKKILKKSTEAPGIKKKSSSSTSDLPRKVAGSSSEEVLSAGNFLPTTSKVKSSSLKSSKVGPSKKSASSVTHKTPASGQNQVSKDLLPKNKESNEKQGQFGSSLASKNITQVNRKHQLAKNLSHEKMHVYSLSDDSSDLPNGLVSSDDDDSGDDDAGYDMGGSSNDTGNQDDGEEVEGGSEYMEEMRRFMEESSSEDDISDECYRIFQEEQTKARARGQSSKFPKRSEERRSSNSAQVSTGKQRVAHSSKFGEMKRKPTPKKPANARLSAAQMCHNRYLMMERRLERASQEQEAGEATASASITGKKRVAHQPVSTNNTLRQLTLGEPSSEKKTTTVMTSKMGKRTAHMPKKVSKRPVIPTDYGSKVPMNIRQRYLNVFIDELLKTAEDDQDAFDKALEEEKLVYQRSSTKNIYLNLCVNALKKLKNQTESRLQSPPSTPTLLFPSKVVSHEAVLGGKLAAQTSYSIHKHSNLDSESFEGIHLYDKLQRYILTEVQLRENGYPRPSEISGQAIIYKEDANKKVVSSDPNQQICCRCGTTYLRLPNGKYITRDSCTYHWGRPWTRRIAGSIESRFSCCSGDMQTKGCCIAKYHVTNNKEGNLLGYMKTIPKDIPRNGHPGMYSLDCEMCYTSMGLELTRVTVIDEHLNEVYDTLVQPDNEVVDYNTRFSGITEDDLRHVRTKLRDVQAVLLNMFSAQTILMGHSLESDFLALKLMHSTVIDTAIVFPHRRGPPLKRALKTLMAEYLNRLIQDDVGGHDSTEDARSCMELMIYKVKEDAKVKRKR